MNYVFPFVHIIVVGRSWLNCVVLMNCGLYSLIVFLRGHSHETGHSSDGHADLCGVAGPQPATPDAQPGAPRLGPSQREHAGEDGVLRGDNNNNNNNLLLSVCSGPPPRPQKFWCEWTAFIFIFTALLTFTHSYTDHNDDLCMNVII